MEKLENVRALSKSGPQSVGFLSNQTLAKGLRIIEEHFPALKVTKERLSIWADMLNDLSDEQFVTGIKAFCLAHREIYPNTNIIAHVRHYALTDPNRKTSSEAWGEVLREVSRVGYCGSPIFSNSEIKRSVECVGWRDICSSENIGVERAHFQRAYDGIVERDRFVAVSRSA